MLIPSMAGRPSDEEDAFGLALKRCGQRENEEERDGKTEKRRGCGIHRATVECSARGNEDASAGPTIYDLSDTLLALSRSRERTETCVGF